MRHKVRWSLIGYTVAIILFTYFIFSSTLKNDFTNWDDPRYVINNAAIQKIDLEHIQAIFSNYSIYQPLTFLTYVFDYHLAQLTPSVFHFTSLLFHVCNTFLVIVFVSTLTGKAALGLTAGLLFGIHPLHVESVAWVSARKDVVFSFFYLCSLISYLFYKRSLSLNWLRSCFICFFASILAKPMAVTLPLVLILIDYVQENKLSKRVLYRKIPFFMLSLVFGAATIIFTHSNQELSSGEVFTLTDRFFLSLHAVILYLEKILFPFQISAFYLVPSKSGIFLPWDVYFSPLALIILSCILFRKYSKGIFGFIFFLISISLNLHFFPVGDAIIADRYTYLPLLGIIYIAALLLRDLWYKYPKLLGRAIVVLVFISYVACLSFLSWTRMAVWQNSETLWKDVIKNQPDIPLGYYQLGNYYDKRNDIDLAIENYSKAILLKPDNALVYYTLGIVYAKKGEYQLAYEAYLKAISLEPGNASYYNNRGTILSYMGKWDAALLDYQTAIGLNPKTDYYFNRGIAFLVLKSYDKALEDFNRVLSADSQYKGALENKGCVEKEILRNHIRLNGKVKVQPVK